MLDDFHGAVLLVDECLWCLGLLPIIGIGFANPQTKCLWLMHFTESIRMATSGDRKEKERRISSSEAFWISMGARIEIGNIADVGPAVMMGGAGVIFWMRVFALIGTAGSFAECTFGTDLQGKEVRRPLSGGPAYHIENSPKNPKSAISVALAHSRYVRHRAHWRAVCQ